MNISARPRSDARICFANFCNQPIRGLPCFPLTNNMKTIKIIPQCLASKHRRICDNFAVETGGNGNYFQLYFQIITNVAGSGLSPDDPLLMSEQGESQDGHYFIKVILLHSVVNFNPLMSLCSPYTHIHPTPLK